jgi:hypothetical protein
MYRSTQPPIHALEDIMDEPTAIHTATAFEHYYCHYLELHQTRGCRLLHAAGWAAALVLAGLAGWSGQWWALLFAPMSVYACCWSGHWLFEKNTPATLHHPWLAFLCYWRMTWDTLLGRQAL